MVCNYKQCNHSCEEKNNVGVLSTHRYLMVFFDIIVDEIEFISVLVDKAPVLLIAQHFQASSRRGSTLLLLLVAVGRRQSSDITLY